MKNLSIYLFAFLAFSLSMTSCKKDKDLDKQMEELNENPPQTPTNDWFFSYQMDGTTYVSEGILAYGINDVDDNVVRAYGLSSDLEDAMYIEIPKGPGNGTYAITDEVFGILSLDGAALGTYFGAEHVGEITLNYESETVLSGEFSFRLFNADKPEEFSDVTNGKFRVAYRD